MPESESSSRGGAIVPDYRTYAWVNARDFSRQTIRSLQRVPQFLKLAPAAVLLAACASAPPQVSDSPATADAAAVETTPDYPLADGGAQSEAPIALRQDAPLV